MKITRIRVTNYMGLATLDASIPAAGAIVKGSNSRGKTSVLKALRAALAAQDVSPSAIRIGADKAEILVDLEDISVRRIITQRSATVSVERAGMKASKPTAYLTELLGTSPLDPLDLFLAKPKERKSLILAALPVTVTREQLEQYAPDILPEGFDCSGHGLEVVERARKFVYDERTLANKEAAEAKREADRLAEEARKAASAVTPGPVVPADQARAAVAAAEREIVSLETRASQAAQASARTAAQRAQIAKLRAEAAAIAVVEAVDLTPLLNAESAAIRTVAELEERLIAARRALADAQRSVAAARQSNERRALDEGRIRLLDAQAAALESALAATGIEAPSPEEIGAAEGILARTKADLERASLQAAALAAVEAADKAAAEATHLAGEADELDKIVKRLANDAPTELLSACDGIPGLSLEGDEVLLDGKRLDALCGAEQMVFAVEIARRANAKSKIIVCDGLERLDAEQMQRFVAMATAGGYQLLGTRVASGDVFLEAIEPGETAQAAE